MSGSTTGAAVHGDPEHPLVPMQTQGEQIPFFCAHGVVPALWYLRELSRHLGSGQPFYGLQVQGVSGLVSPHSTVEDIAARFATAIRSVQPEGPYRVGGFSFGGVIAFELAQQLRRMGQDVTLVALIDTYFPRLVSHVRPRTRFAHLALSAIATTERHADELAARGPVGYLRGRLIYVRDGLRRRAARIARRLAVRSVPAEWDLAEPIRRVVAANTHALATYEPQPYAGRVVQFCGARASLVTVDTRLAWSEVADSLEVHHVPGDHLTLRHERHIAVLANKLRARLEDNALNPGRALQAAADAIDRLRYAILPFASLAASGV